MPPSPDRRRPLRPRGTARPRPRPAVRSLLVALAAALLSGCSAPGGLGAGGSQSGATGLLILTAGGTALSDGDQEVPTTLDLRLVASSPLDPRSTTVTLDGAALPLARDFGALTARVAPMALGSAHALDVDVPGRDPRHIGFRVVPPAGVHAALHAGAAGAATLDLAFELAPDRPAVEGVVPGGRHRWVDGTHLTVTWPRAPGGLLVLPGGIPAARGSHLAAETRLALGPVAAGTVRSVTTPAASALAGRPLVLAFSVGTAASRASAAAHGGQISALSPAGLVARADGSLGGGPDGPAVAGARAQGVPVLPLLQNDQITDSGPVGSLLADQAATARLVAAVRARAAAQGWRGVHLDFENVPPDSRDALSGLVSDLAAALHSDGRLLAVAVVPHKPGHLNVTAAAFDLAAIGRAADLVTVMSYEEHSPATGPGPVAGLDWDGEVLGGTLPELGRPDRALLGLAFYARTWSASGRSAEDYQSAVSDALAEPGARCDYDFDAMTPFIHGDAGVPVTYYDDADSLARKVALVSRHAMAGIAVWRLGFEDPAVWSILPPNAPRA